jgi:acylphosphatase
MVQAHIIFSGMVQGVGFRFTVQRRALHLGLNGWVKNLPDGSVEILVDGPKETIEELCQNIEDDFEGYIQDREVQFTPAEEKLTSFRITY